MYYKWSLIMIITKFKSIWYLQKQMSKSYMHWTHFAKIKETKGVLVEKLQVMNRIREHPFGNILRSKNSK